MRHKQFSYSNINAEPYVSNADLQVMTGHQPGTDYIGFAYFGKEDTNTHMKRKAGWKFHISIDDSEPSNIEKAWNVLVDYFIDRQVTTLKILKAGKLAASDPEQRGKQITVYAHHDPDKDWPTMLTEITQLLKDNEVKPSYRPPSDRAVPGSHYLSYRNDAEDEAGKKVSFSKLSYNPKRFADPYGSIVVEVAGQPDLPVWAGEEGARVAPAAGAGFGAGASS